MLNSGWRVFEACGGGIIHELKDTPRSFEKRNLFCFTTNETRCHLVPVGEHTYRFTLKNQDQVDLNYVEFLFNDRDHDFFYFSGDRDIKRSLGKSFLTQSDIIFLSPEIVLLYKSTYLDSIHSTKHTRDFEAVLPFISYDQRQWLRKALEIVHEGNHQWLLDLRYR
jgi:hypothetical protein